MRTPYLLGAIAVVLVGAAVAVPGRRAAAQSTDTDQASQLSTVMLAKSPQRFATGEVIVKRSATAGAGILSVEQMTPLGLEPSLRTTSGGEVIYRLDASVMSGMSAEDRAQRVVAAADNIRKMPGVQYAQPNYFYRITDTTPNDGRFKEQWHYLPNGTGAGKSPGGIGLPHLWDQNKGNNEVVVAVIDTGILGKHPDIVGSPNLLAGFDMVTDPFVANDGGGRDNDPTDPGDAVAAGECGLGWPPSAQPSSWHGTHVAGTIGVGNTNNGIGVAGINWNLKILPIRVLGKCGGTTADINDAIRWAAGLPVPGVPKNDHKANVINMSLGGPQACSADPATQSAIKDAIAQNVTVVVAAGNDGEDASTSSPASCDGVITVAASDFRGVLAPYSNFGSTVEIMAPGGDRHRDDNHDGNPDGVLSMVDPSAGTYAYYNGTSMATPHVAGVAALLLACDKTLTPAQILDRLQKSAMPRTAAQCPHACGAGLLNALVALPPTCTGKAGPSVTQTKQ